MAKDSSFNSPFDTAPAAAGQTTRRKLDDYHAPQKDTREVKIDAGPEHDFDVNDHSLFRPRPLHQDGFED